jgi:hypothetical protein
MEQKYKYEALESLNAAYNNQKNDDSTKPLETQFLNEAVNFVKDSGDGIITAIRNVPDGDGRNDEQRVSVPYEEIKDLSQKEILEEIGRRFSEEYE